MSESTPPTQPLLTDGMDETALKEARGYTSAGDTAYAFDRALEWLNAHGYDVRVSQAQPPPPR